MIPDLPNLSPDCLRAPAIPAIPPNEAQVRCAQDRVHSSAKAAPTGDVVFRPIATSASSSVGWSASRRCPALLSARYTRILQAFRPTSLGEDSR